MDALSPTRVASDRTALEGTLRDLGAIELLGLLGRTRQTGTLQVVGTTTALLTLVDGAVSYATDDPARTVKELLLQRGVVSDATWQVAAGDPYRPLGDALVANGVHPDQLRRIIHDQVVDVVMDLAVAPEGRFRFVTGRRHELGEQFHYAAGALEADVRSRLAEWDHLRTVVPSTDQVAHLTSQLPDGRRAVSIAADDWPLVAWIDGSRTVAELRRQCGWTLFATCRSVAALVAAGAVELASALGS